MGPVLKMKKKKREEAKEVPRKELQREAANINSIIRVQKLKEKQAELKDQLKAINAELKQK